MADAFLSCLEAWEPLLQMPLIKGPSSNRDRAPSQSCVLEAERKPLENPQVTMEGKILCQGPGMG